MRFHAVNTASAWQHCICSPIVRDCFYVLLAAFFLCVTPQTGFAQLTTAEEKGLPSNSVFSGGDVDVVNLQNGNLHISIPLVSSAQRGGSTLEYAFVYDTQAWIKQWNQYALCGLKACSPPGHYLAEENTNVVSGWRITSPFNWSVESTNSGSINCATISQTYEQFTNWVIIDPEGTQHSLPLRMERGQYSCLGQTLAGPALDGSGLYFNSQTGLIYTKDGYQISGSIIPSLGVGLFGPGQDRNGNLTTETSDTLGRNLLTTSGGTNPDGTGFTTYTITNSAGKPLVFRIDYQNVTITTDICAATTGISAYSCADYTIVNGLPSKITLPTGKAYVFKYANDTPGDLIEMDLPTGGVITYQYEDFYQPKYVSGQSDLPNFVGSRAVTKRTVTINGQSNFWTYTPNPNTGIDTVTDPLGNYQVHTFSFVDALNGSQLIESSNWYEVGVAYHNSQGQLLRTTNNTYAADYDPVNNTTANVRVIQTTTTLDNGQTSEKQTDYETFPYTCVDCGTGTGIATRLNPTEVREFDYGAAALGSVGPPGSLLKRTDYAYLHTNNQSYINLNIVDKPTTITVYNGSGNMVAQTVNEYDIYSHTGQPMQPSGAIQHNTSYGTGFITRGNLTAVSKWRNTDGAYITTTNQYDDAGNILSTIDPLGYQTSYSYADSWVNAACVPSGTAAAFPTKVTNAKGQFSTITYSACTGTVGSTTDVNRQTTTYTYDSFDRPWQILIPGGGSKIYCYSDNPNGSCYSESSLFTTETVALNKSTNLLQTTLYDGLGRVQETQLNSDPQGTIYVDTQYDGDGRGYKVSNPYRFGDTEYWTTKLYDGIGRSAGVIEQDNSSTSITYVGNTSLSTDEAGNERSSQTDALGRLTGVWEDPIGLNYETDYQYDILGDLLQATQKGGNSNPANWRVRTFTYNSLGQLLCAANPEITSQRSTVATCPMPDTGTYTAGTTRYQYDNDGNLISKTSPLPNQIGTATLVTSYSYDTLNRILKKSYNDSSTPSTCYQYDSTFLGIGRLANEWTQSATVPSCAASFPPNNKYLTARSILVYDPMGRVLNEQQYAPSSMSTGVPYAMAYTYDLAGNLTSSTSGVAPPSMTFSSTVQCPSASPLITTMLTFVSCYDAAGHLQSVASNVSSGPASLFSGPGYAAFGGLTGATLGNNAVTLTRTYDSRLRITSEQDKGNSPGTSTSGSATVTITGVEQSR